MSRKKKFNWWPVIVLSAVLILVFYLKASKTSGDDRPEVSKPMTEQLSEPMTEQLSEPKPDPEQDPLVQQPAVKQTPAVDADWMELPGAVAGGNYLINTYYEGTVRNYTHLYDTDTYTSMWVAYPLNSRYMGNQPRPNKWSYSSMIDSKYQVNLKNRSYNDKYSRGHLIPNASRNGFKDMQLQTFFVTNSVPQIQNRFNSGIWSSLESALQSLASAEEIFIVTGVAFNKVGEDKAVSYTTARDDTKDVPVPNYFYKVVLKVNVEDSAVSSACSVGFWFEHKAYTDTFVNYAVSVDQIEEWTGFDFFVNLPDSIETLAESNSSWTVFQEF